jgi:hypothetical protein
MRIWKHSIQLHLWSLALSDSIINRSPGARDDLPHDPEKAALGAIALWPVVAGAIGILEEFALLTPSRLRSAPGFSNSLQASVLKLDILAILPDLAAVCLWRVSLACQCCKFLQPAKSLQLLSVSTVISQTLNYAEQILALISGVIRNFRDAIIDRTDTVLLHARFLLSVATRIRKGVKKRQANDVQYIPKTSNPFTSDSSTIPGAQTVQQNELRLGNPAVSGDDSLSIDDLLKSLNPDHDSFQGSLVQPFDSSVVQLDVSSHMFAQTGQSPQWTVPS